MPSKSNARRRAARGIGRNGVPQIPSHTSEASASATGATEGLAGSEDVQSENGLSVPNGDHQLGDAAQESTTQDQVPVNHKSSVIILFQTKSTGSVSDQYEYVGTIPTGKILCASQRIRGDFNGVDLSLATEWQYAIQGEGFTLTTVKAFIEWLNTVKCPFPSSYHGTRQIAWSSAWTNHQIANLLVFMRWLGLKAPFVTSSLENRLWSFIKDHARPLDTGAVLAIWDIASPTAQDEKLKDHAIWRAANIVQTAGNAAAEQAQDAVFSNAFAANQVLLAAYKAKLENNRRIEEDKIRRNEAWLETKAKREWKEQQAMKKNHEASGQRELLDRRGVSTISWEEAQAGRR